MVVTITSTDGAEVNQCRIKKRRWLKRTNLFVIYAVWIAGISQVWKDISIGHQKPEKPRKTLVAWILAVLSL